MADDLFGVNVELVEDGGPALIAACLIGAGQAIYTATSAKNAGKCLKLKMSIIGPPVYLGGYSYSGGYCK